MEAQLIQLLLEIIDNQKKCMVLMEAQISLQAANASLAAPSSSMDPYTRQNAGTFVKKAFEKRYQRMNPDFWD